MEIKYTVNIEPEDSPVRGNYMCTDDPEQDRKDEDEIIARLRDEDISAWCTISVTASLNDFKYTAVLGCCSLHADDNIEEFAKDNGLYEEAIMGLRVEVNETLDKANRASKVLSTLL